MYDGKKIEMKNNEIRKGKYRGIKGNKWTNLI